MKWEETALKRPQADALELCSIRQSVRFRTRTIVLGDLSFRLLERLSAKAPAPLRFDEIERLVWAGHVTRETIKQRVKLLRESLADLGAPDDAIVASRNVGYRLTMPCRRAGAEAAPIRKARERIAILSGLVVALSLFALLGLGVAPAPAADLRVAVRTLSPAVQDASADAARTLAGQLSHLSGVEVVSPHAPDDAEADLIITLARQGEDSLLLELSNASTRVILLARSYRAEPNTLGRALEHFTRLVSEQVGAERSLASAGPRARQRYLEALTLARMPGEHNLVAARTILSQLLLWRHDAPHARALRARINAELALRHGHSRGVAERARTEARALVARYPATLEFRHTLARAELACGDLGAALTRLREIAPSLTYVNRDIAALERGAGEKL